MRILYLDLDCLRPDHLGCYGYPRATSPAIDGIARRGVRFDGVYASDVPCLPSRTAFFSGRFGITTGVVGHGGTGADPYPEGPTRGFASRWNLESFMRRLRDRGLYTATISSFGERHSAFHFYANFNEIQNPGQRGLERAEVIGDLACDWLRRNRGRRDWFLHVHFWDPHMPYRTPADFAPADLLGAAPPAWLTEEVLERHRAGCGPHSAREVIGYSDRPPPGLPWDYPRQPTEIATRADAHAMFDGYDLGIRYADAQIARILEVLDEQAERSDTAILVSGDHGENLGELNVYGDHQTADEHTCHVPFLMLWPGVTDALAGQALAGLHYQVDLTATVIELAGGSVPASWDGRSLAADLRRLAATHNEGQDHPPHDEVPATWKRPAPLPLPGRDELVLSQGAWACQRALRWDIPDGPDRGRWLCVLTLHDAFHLYPEAMLFELTADPHEQHDLAPARPRLVQHALARIDAWTSAALARSGRPDPLRVVLAEGGPKHTRGELPAYLDRLRATDRGSLAAELLRKHGPTAPAPLPTKP